MCGIIGYIGERRALPVLLNGLSRLEYRGYDSAGIACLDPGIWLVKEKGKLHVLQEKVNGANVASSIGIGHTRWATHGEPSQANAHPHTDCRNQLALVHNGIIENYSALRRELVSKGHRFQSQTDTEVLVHLIEAHDRGNLTEALRCALKKVQGYFAFVLMSAREPERLYVFKRSNPLVIGRGQDEHFIASDVPALLPYTREVIFLEDEDLAVIEKGNLHISSLKNHRPLRRRTTHIEWSLEAAEKGGYAHYMLKEIEEQPRVIENLLKLRILKNAISFDTIPSKFEKKLQSVKKIRLVSCGTAYHAGLVGNYMLGQYARIPTETTVSSEFRYEDPIVGREDLVILITQSGETADTLAALREAKAKRATTLGIVNVVGSTIAREAELVLYTHAGPEIGVASTKAYSAQLVTLLLFTFYLARLRKSISEKTYWELIREMQRLPLAAKKALNLRSAIQKSAQECSLSKNFLYLARGYNYPNALEGALKLKEITYAHAHGYPAGEMKHGPIALIDQELPVICIAPQSKTYEKMISNIEEIRAREGKIIALGTEGDQTLESLSWAFFPIPKVPEVLSPVLSVIPLQLFAYEVAVLNGRDVDQPRNLAKSVTVE